MYKEKRIKREEMKLTYGNQFLSSIGNGNGNLTSVHFTSLSHMHD